MIFKTTLKCILIFPEKLISPKLQNKFWPRQGTDQVRSPAVGTERNILIKSSLSIYRGQVISLCFKVNSNFSSVKPNDSAR